MATFKEFVRITEISLKDKTSSKRARQILSIMRKYRIQDGLTPEKAVRILEALGPMYVKIGQLASSRSDLLPREYCEAFECLHDNVEPLSYETVLQAIDGSYGHSWKKVFSSIEEKPLGSASIAQVHKAVLLDGTVVAVKVRRPGVVEQMAEDLTLMKHMLALAEFATTSHHDLMLNMESLLQELERTTDNETDFLNELNNLIRFKEVIASQKLVECPTPYPLYSTDAVLVEQYIRGIPISDTEALRRQGCDIKALATRMTASYMSQVIDSGFFHADPHAGNIIISGKDLVWIDLGMVGTLGSAELELVNKAFFAVATHNAYELTEAVLGLSTPHADVDYGELLSRITKLLDKYGTADVADINIGVLFEEVIEVLRKQSLIVHPAVTMLARGFVTLEGVLSQIAPETNMVKILSERVIAHAFEPKAVLGKIAGVAGNVAYSAEAATKIPSQISHTLDMLDKGELKVNGAVKIPERAFGSLYEMVGRLAMALISAGLFVGSSLLCTTDMQPKFLEVPILGVLGFVGAFILGVYVIYRTIRSRHQFVNNLEVD